MNVHNHGPEDGPGIACRERPLPTGKPIGACMIQQHAQRLNEITAAVTYARVSDFDGAYPTLRNAILWVLQLQLDATAPQETIIGPDCRDLNHQKCRGDAWDEEHDHITECGCSCHVEAAPPAYRVIDTDAELQAAPDRIIVQAADGTVATRYDAECGVVFGYSRTFPWSVLRAPAVVLREAM